MSFANPVNLPEGRPWPLGFAYLQQFRDLINMDDEDFIEYGVFEKIDIRIGKIVEVNDFPEAKKAAYKLRIDFGDIGIKQSSAQITSLYKKDDLLHKQVVAVVNFKPKKIAGFYSECLVLGVSENGKDVILLTPDGLVKNGLKVY
jgi:tRNA-binding protein